MDFTQAFQLAQSRDPTVQMALAQWHAAQAGIVEARGAQLPQLSVSLNAATNHLSRSDVNSPYDEQRYASQSHSLILRQDLWQPNNRIAEDIALNQVTQASAALQAARADLLKRLLSSYLDARYAQDQLTWVKEQQKQVNINQDSAHLRVQQGIGTKTEVLNAKQSELNIQSRMQEIESARQVALEQWGILLGQVTPAIEAPRWQVFQWSPPHLDLIQGWSQARSRNPELQRLTQRVNLAELDLRRRQVSRWPTAQGYFRLERNVNDSVQATNSVYHNRQIGIQVSIPLYAGGSLNAAVEKSGWLLAHEKQAFDAGQQNLRISLLKTQRHLMTLKAQQSAAEHAIENASQNIENAQKHRDAGSASDLDVLEASVKLSESITKAKLLRYQQLLTWLDWETATGTPVADLVAQLEKVIH